MLGFGALILFIAWAWQRTQRQAQTAQPLTPAWRTWNAVVFLVLLAAMAALVWWAVTYREALRWAPGSASARRSLARTLRQAGRPAEADAEERRVDTAGDLSPTGVDH